MPTATNPRLAGEIANFLTDRQPDSSSLWGNPVRTGYPRDRVRSETSDNVAT